MALAALWWVNRQIAKRFHRRFNVGLAAAAIAVAVLTLVAVVLAQDQSGDNDELVDGSYQDAADGAAARTARQRRQGQREPAAGQARVRPGVPGRLASRPPRQVEDLASGDTLTAWERVRPPCTSEIVDAGRER